MAETAFHVAPAVPAPPRTTVEFTFDREPDPAWVRRLRERWPISNQTTWPYLVWEPGDPWIPGERWVLYEMTPSWLVLDQYGDGDTLVDELYGPHPRSDGHFCSDREWRHTSSRWPKQFSCLCKPRLRADPITGKSVMAKPDAWKGSPAQLITLTQWKLFRRWAGAFVPFPQWVIQGTTGGHAVVYDEFQQHMLKQAEQPAEPPVLGALPYAPFDERVMQALMREHYLRHLGLTVSEYRRTMGADYAGYKAGIEKEMRRQWVEHLSTQLTDVNDLFLRVRPDEIDDANQGRRTTVDFEKLDDLSTQHYIETGKVLTPEQISTPLMVSMAGSHRS